MKKNLCQYFLPAALIIGITGGIAGFQVSQVFSHADSSDSEILSNDETKKLYPSYRRDDDPRTPKPIDPGPLI